MITAEDAAHLYAIGQESAQEVADAVNCPDVGTLGHCQCGVCPKHNTSRKICGCMLLSDGVTVSR